ncbi:MAG: TfuA-like protein [Candidatus Acidiferrales bacterium]
MTIYVFTGPTLPAEEARRELDAVYLPPASQGDVYRVGLQRPWAIGIIDGYFDRVPAVWHKEILWAMTQGIHVYGAASMGALRAAELAPFGMVGVGKVFESFRDGLLEDDDEVAVVHSPAEKGFRSGSEAMVNIRLTLAAAQEATLIRPESRRALESLAKALYYPDRSYPRLLADAAQQNLPAQELDAFRAWLPSGRVDQKRADALAMLRALGRHQAESPEPKRVSFVLEHTKFWDRAIQSAGVAEAGSDGRTGMVSSTSVLEELRLDARAYARARQEVLLHHLVLDQARQRGYAVTAEDEREAEEAFRREQGLLGEKEFGAWLAAHHLTPQRFSGLMREKALVRRVLPRLREEALFRLPDHLRLTAQYRPLLSRALDKQLALEEAGLPGAAPDDAGLSEEFLLAWFLKNLGPADENNVEGQAAVLEFAHRNLRTFMTALAREYCYLDIKRNGSHER